MSMGHFEMANFCQFSLASWEVNFLGQLARLVIHQFSAKSRQLGVSKNKGTPKWMVYCGKTLLKWMISGYHYFWKHPYRVYYRVNKMVALNFIQFVFWCNLCVPRRIYGGRFEIIYWVVPPFQQ